MTDCCNGDERERMVIIGGGSAAFAAAIEAEAQGAEVVVVNDGLPVGGTCVNVGCVPSKFLLRAAETHHSPTHHGFLGIDAESTANFSEVVAQKRRLVGKLREQKYIDILDAHENVHFRRGHAKFVEHDTIYVGEETLEADTVVLATGASPASPDIDGLEETGYLTNESAFELEAAPESMVVLGGGYVGLESAQTFSRFGTDVSVLDHSSVLSGRGSDLTDELAEYLRDEGIDIYEDTDIERVDEWDDGVRVVTNVEEDRRTFKADELLVATGRRPNTQNLGADRINLALDDDGFVVCDDYLESSVDGVYAAGDVTGSPMYVYTAAREGKIAARNALGESSVLDESLIPWVVFTDPQFAGIGLDERQAREQGYTAESTTLPLSEIPRARAAQDIRGSIRLVRDRDSDRLLGARILAPEGGELVMQIALAVRTGTTVAELTDLLHPYLTLSEGIRLAALTFDQDVGELSCCAG